MKILSVSTNLNSNLPLSVSVWEIDNDSYQKSKSAKLCIEDHFKILRDNNFNIQDRQSTYKPESNYSNYLMSKIVFSDFKKTSVNEYKHILEKEINNWAKVYNAINEIDLNWFIETTINQIDLVARKYSECYLFNLPPDAVSDKRHPHFTLYEFFISLIFYNSNAGENKIGYVVLAYG